MKTVIALTMAASILAGCDNSSARPTGPERQECAHLKTGEVFKFRLDAVKRHGSDGIEFTDEAGWRRVITPSNEGEYKCREIAP